MDLLKKHGWWFKANVDDRDIEEGRILVEDDKVYLCQNFKDGSECLDNERFGYRYSWTVLGGSENDLTINSVRDLILFEHDPSSSTGLPEKWCVLNNNSKLFKDYVLKYIQENDKHNYCWRGDDINRFYGYDGYEFDTYTEDEIKEFKVLTIEQFINLTTNKTNQEHEKSIKASSGIKVQRPIATITSRKRPTGSGISGHRSPTTTSSRHLSYNTIIGV